MALPGFATRFAFFTGKGGVGKTSLACASAVRLAEQGRRVLLVSTDPASNLDEMLETPLTTSPTAVAGVPGDLVIASMAPFLAFWPYFSMAFSFSKIVICFNSLIPAFFRASCHSI